MYLTISRRFEFCASHKYSVSDWTSEKNFRVFGPEAKSAHGHGHNYTAYFVLHGPVDPATGMMKNLLHVKRKIAPIIDERFDHKYLNVDTPPFDRIQPTPENLATMLLHVSKPIFAQDSVQPVACHLRESADRAATAFGNGLAESIYWMDFSAAARSYSPYLSDEENRALFGLTSEPGGSGHHYRVRVTLRGEIDAQTGTIVPDQVCRGLLCRLRTELNHRNLNEVSDLKNGPITNEILALHLWYRLQSELPLSCIRLYDSDEHFVEYHGNMEFRLGLMAQFRAAHRLYSHDLSDAENEEVYGVCGNPNGHGHLFDVECTLGGTLEERSGTTHNLNEVSAALTRALDDWDYKHLNHEVSEFENRLPTGENIIQSLWQKLDPEVGGNLQRLRLMETVNNRFALRRGI